MLPTHRVPVPPRSELGPCSAFTLLELLVVLLVLALLACSLVPLRARTYQDSNTVQCVNNLRQLMLAWKMYSDDYQGKLCPNRLDTTQPNWVKGFMDFSANSNNTNIYNLIGSGALLGPYLNSPTYFKCPADKSTILTSTARLPRVRSYSMNGWVGEGTQAWNGSNYRLYQKNIDIVSPTPANLWVLIDEHEASINDGWFATAPSSLPSNYIIVDYPAARHNRACGVSFADGRAEIHAWQDPRTMPPGSLQFNVASPNNFDVGWFNQHSTSPP